MFHVLGTFRDLLTACQKRIHFLNQETKLRWCMIPYAANLSTSADILQTSSCYTTYAQMHFYHSSLKCLLKDYVLAPGYSTFG